MSVLVIITHEANAAALTRWGHHFARGQKEDLILVRAKLHSKHTDLALVHDPTDHPDPVIQTIYDATMELRQSSVEQVDNEPDITIKYMATQHRLIPLMEEISEVKPRLILLSKQRSSRNGGDENLLARNIFRRTTCTTILMRLGESDDSRAEHILIPTAGGPHSVSALKTAAAIADDHQSQVTALYIEPPGDEVASEVGEHVLEEIMRRAGVEPSDHLHARVEVSDDVNRCIARVAEEGFDLILVGATRHSIVRKALFGTIPDRLFTGENSTTIALVKAPEPLITKFQNRIERWLDLTVPQLSRDERITLFESLQNNSRWNFDFLALIGLSTAIATLGLIQDSAAVVIGAMLVAPLMSPLLGCGLAIVQGNFPLFRASLKSISLGFLVALTIGVVFGLLGPINELTDELRARGGPTLLDLGVALLSGIAAAYCTGRPNLSAALPGVAIAAALVPPIATAGISLSLQQYANAQGAALLFGTNVVAIILGASMAFYAGGVRAKKDQKSSTRWVRRTLLTLALATVMLLIPLTSVLYNQYIKPHPLHISEPLKEEIEKYLRTELGARLVNIDTEQDIDRPVILLDIQSPITPNKQQTTRLAALARGFIHQDLKVRLRTDLVIESPNPKIEAEFSAPK